MESSDRIQKRLLKSAPAFCLTRSLEGDGIGTYGYSLQLISVGKFRGKVRVSPQQLVDSNERCKWL
jgi:hypothetical protein